MKVIQQVGSEPNQDRRKYMWLRQGKRKLAQVSHDWIWFYFRLEDKVAQLFSVQKSLSVVIQNQSKYVLSENRYVRPRPNDRNISKQHITTLLGATCCARLTALVRGVATCWVLWLKFENGQI